MNVDLRHTGRANGLDTLRAAAIVLVIMNHYMAFVSHRPTFGWASVVGWTRVNLFFLLSGHALHGKLRNRWFRTNFSAARERSQLRTLPVAAPTPGDGG